MSSSLFAFLKSLAIALLAVVLALNSLDDRNDRESLASLRRALYSLQEETFEARQDVRRLQAHAEFLHERVTGNHVALFEQASDEPSASQANAVSGPASAEGQTGDVDVAALIRRGPSVEHVVPHDEPTVEQSVERIVAQTIEQTPPDDRDRFFVSILVGDDCPHCDRLIADWKTSPHLQALGHLPPAWGGDASKRSESWAHVHVYHAGDETQRHRWAKVKLGGVPTVIVQAPLSGKFGPSTDVVFQRTGYGGDDERLLADARAALKLRIETFAPDLLDDEAAKRPGKALVDRLRDVGAGAEAGAPPSMSDGTERSGRTSGSPEAQAPKATASGGSPGPKPTTRGPSLLPTVDQDVRVPPDEVLAKETEPEERPGVVAALGQVYDECDAATSGNLWWMLGLAAAGLLQQFLDRRYPGGPDDPQTPKLAGLLQRILTPLTALLGPRRGSQGAGSGDPRPARPSPATTTPPEADDAKLLDRLEERMRARAEKRLREDAASRHERQTAEARATHERASDKPF